MCPSDIPMGGNQPYNYRNTSLSMGFIFKVYFVITRERLYRFSITQSGGGHVDLAM
jgi:hypothetical protein